MIARITTTYAVRVLRLEEHTIAVARWAECQNGEVYFLDRAFHGRFSSEADAKLRRKDLITRTAETETRFPVSMNVRILKKCTHCFSGPNSEFRATDEKKCSRCGHPFAGKAEFLPYDDLESSGLNPDLPDSVVGNR